MDAGLAIAASGMVAEQLRQDQLANDLANASTPGFKPDESEQRDFGTVLLANTQGGAPVGTLDESVIVGPTFTNMTPGPIQETGEPLDFAIEGSGFFSIRTPEGVRYTRDGQFTVSSAGILTDASGNPVLGPSGQEVHASTGTALPASAIGVFEVTGAKKLGENLYTGTPAGSSKSDVRSGALEASTLDAAKAMVEMVSALRSFQSGQQAIQTIGQTLQEAATQVGSLPT